MASPPPPPADYVAAPTTVHVPGDAALAGALTPFVNAENPLPPAQPDELPTDTTANWAEHERFAARGLREAHGAARRERRHARAAVRGRPHDVAVEADDGTRVAAHRSLLAHHSRYFRAIWPARTPPTGAPESEAPAPTLEFAETSGDAVRLGQVDGPSLRGVVAWMYNDNDDDGGSSGSDVEGVDSDSDGGAVPGVEGVDSDSDDGHGAVACQALEAARIVATARAAHFLGVDDLFGLCSARIAGAVDVENCGALISLALELDDMSLWRQCIAFASRALGDCEATDAWDYLPAEVKQGIRHFRHAARVSPLGGSAAGDNPHEFLSICRESLHDQRERLKDSREWQAREVVNESASAAYAERMLRNQEQRLETLACFVRDQERMFGGMISSGRARPSPPPGDDAPLPPPPAGPPPERSRL